MNTSLISYCLNDRYPHRPGTRRHYKRWAVRKARHDHSEIELGLSMPLEPKPAPVATATAAPKVRTRTYSVPVLDKLGRCLRTVEVQIPA